MLDGCANDIVVMVKCGVLYGAALESERRERHQREQQVGRRWDQGAAEHHHGLVAAVPPVVWYRWPIENEIWHSRNQSNRRNHLNIADISTTPTNKSTVSAFINRHRFLHDLTSFRKDVT